MDHHILIPERAPTPFAARKLFLLGAGYGAIRRVQARQERPAFPRGSWRNT
jgi:hypothetical protein